MATYEPTPGDHIKHSVDEALKLANATGEPVSFKFNELELIAFPGGEPKALLDEFARLHKERHAAWLMSPAGIEHKRRVAAHQERARVAQAEGILPFDVSNPEWWQKSVSANADPYGSAVTRYAARWANMMEKRIANGERIADFADACSHEADAEGITGFMHGCAVQILAKCWRHGEELRRWHNLRTQARDEGERANESGAVLNPAMLTLSI